MSPAKGDRRQNRQRAKYGNRRGGFFSMIVEPYRQVKLGLIILLLNTIFGLCIAAVFSYYVYDIYNNVSIFFQFNPEEQSEVWVKYLAVLLVCLSLVSVFFVLTFGLIIRYTHQIYGPLVSLHKYLDDLLAGKNPNPISVRSTDQLQGLAQKINKLAALTPKKDQKETK